MSEHEFKSEMIPTPNPGLGYAPTYKLVLEVTALRDGEAVAFQYACGLGTIPAFEYFLKVWPDSIFSAGAKHYIAAIVQLIRQQAETSTGSGWSPAAEMFRTGEWSREEMTNYEYGGLINNHVRLAELLPIDRANLDRPSK